MNVVRHGAWACHHASYVTRTPRMPRTPRILVQRAYSAPGSASELSDFRLAAHLFEHVVLISSRVNGHVNTDVHHGLDHSTDVAAAGSVGSVTYNPINSILQRSGGSTPVFHGAWLLDFNLDRILPVLLFVVACGRGSARRRTCTPETAPSRRAAGSRAARKI